MAGAEGGQSLEQTPTWAVAVVCFVLVVVSIIIEHAIHLIGKGKVSFVSAKGIHQLHIFIFVLAVFHVLYCIITMALGKAKMGKWKAWEMETRTADYHFSNDPERFRFARDTSFGRRHLSFWSRSSVLLWTVCFFRQFFRSVPKVDYLTLRHGFIVAHLAPESRTKFNFQRYIKRSLEEDFKVVVGWYSYLWLPFLPLIIILLVGTKLQVIITMMGLRIEERGGVVKGTPLVQPGDDLFWFNRPRLIIYLIHFVLFQNAFQLAFFVWTWHQFGLKSCFHEKLEDVIIRISMGVLIQILCSYVTLPLYALVTQMGSTMKPTIFNERVANALRKWHHKAKKNIKQNQHSTSTPVTPMHSMSPVHLLHHYQGELDSIHKTQRMSNFNNEGWDMNGPHSSSHHHDQISMPKNQRNHGQEESSSHEPSSIHSPSSRHSFHVQHESDVHSIDFSFDNT
ncbi:mlo-like protein 6 [Quercus suber]|uniref:MLO-like protein n=1 Tax=Quercus suber TaxID=58331 RepID=A0AAW0LTR1_QUESU